MDVNSNSNSGFTTIAYSRYDSELTDHITQLVRLISFTDLVLYVLYICGMLPTQPTMV